MNFHRPSMLAGALFVVLAGGAATASAADVAAPAIDPWSGFYLGAQAGYLQGSDSDTDLCSKANGFGNQCVGRGISFGSASPDGVTVGGYAGYNYRIDNVLLGVEGDVNWDNASGNNSFGQGVSYGLDLNWDAAIRARLGYVVDDRALLYLTGGPSWLNTSIDADKVCASVSSGDYNCGDSATEFGWQLGAGAEYAITEHLSVKAEYLHGWYGDADLDMMTETVGGIKETLYLKQTLQTNVIRAGVAYHFGGF